MPAVPAAARTVRLTLRLGRRRRARRSRRRPSPGTGRRRARRGDAPPPAPPLGGAELRVSDGSVRPRASPPPAPKRPPALFRRPAPPRRTADGGWSRPSAASGAAALDQPRREAGDDASLNSTLVELRREIRPANPNPTPGFEPGFPPRRARRSTAFGSGPGSVGGGGRSPPAPAVPAFAPPPSLGVRAFGEFAGPNLCRGRWGTTCGARRAAAGGAAAAPAAGLSGRFSTAGDDPPNLPRVPVPTSARTETDARTRRRESSDSTRRWSGARQQCRSTTWGWTRRDAF